MAVSQKKDLINILIKIMFCVETISLYYVDY